MTEDRTDLLGQYHNITHKLRKKRILKKPNVAEANQQFEQLGVLFEREELPQYTGLCYQASAKCQNSLGNTLEEGLMLLKASRQFMSSYLENVNDHYVPNKSFLNHSYMLYRDCLTRLSECEEPSKFVIDALKGSVVLEMADNLNIEANLRSEGSKEYDKALELFSNFPFEKIHCLQKIITMQIELGNYGECLKLVNDLFEVVKELPENGFKETLSRDLEITRIFLLLILRPTPQQISPAAASALEKYAWVETSNSSDVKELSTDLENQGLSILGEDLFLKLQSLVMACQYCDTEDLEILEKDLLEHLNNEQKSLLRLLVKQYKIL